MGFQSGGRQVRFLLLQLDELTTFLQVVSEEAAEGLDRLWIYGSDRHRWTTRER